jgi:hypothetical protein
MHRLTLSRPTLPTVPPECCQYVLSVPLNISPFVCQSVYPVCPCMLGPVILSDPGSVRSSILKSFLDLSFCLPFTTFTVTEVPCFVQLLRLSIPMIVNPCFCPFLIFQSIHVTFIQSVYKFLLPVNCRLIVSLSVAAPVSFSLLVRNLSYHSVPVSVIPPFCLFFLQPVFPHSVRLRVICL